MIYLPQRREDAKKAQNDQQKTFRLCASAAETSYKRIYDLFAAKTRRRQENAEHPTAKIFASSRLRGEKFLEASGEQ